MLESCQETSKLSVDSFMDLYDFIGRQIWGFSKKIVEEVPNTCLTPPLVTFCRDMQEKNFFMKISQMLLN